MANDTFAVGDGGMAIDWSATGAMLSGAGSVLGAAATVFGGVAVLIAANKAASTFNAWKRQKITERKIEQAERILTAAYKVQYVLAAVRGRMLWAHELSSAEEALKDEEGFRSANPQRRGKLISSQVYLDRMRTYQTEREQVIEAIPIARALWGLDLADALTELNRQFWLIECFAEESIDHTYSHEEAARTKVIQQALGASPDDPDNEISNNIKAAVAKIEGYCLPTLQTELEAPVV